MYCLYMTWNCPHDSKNHEDIICFEETSVKVTFKTLQFTVIEKLCRWIFPKKIESYIKYYGYNDRT